MSLNRLIYDDCAYSKRIKESTGPLGYVLNPVKYENCHKCRAELGVLGGTNVSIGSGNLVDAESDLSGRTRLLSQCPTNKYKPTNPLGDQHSCKNDTGIPHDCDECQPAKRHLRPCALFQYKPRPNNVGYTLPEMKCSNGSNNALPNNLRGKLSEVSGRTTEWQGQTGVVPPVPNPRKSNQFIYY